MALARRSLPYLIAISVALSASCGGGDEAPAPPPIDLVAGPTRVHLELRPFRLSILRADGSTVLATLPEGGTTGYGTPASTHDAGVATPKLIAGWDGFEPDEDPWSRGIEASVVSKTATSAGLRFAAPGGAIDLEVVVAEGQVTLRQSSRGGDASTPWNKTGLAFALPQDEHFFGLGERYASVDHRGLSLYTWAEEAGLGAGEGAAKGTEHPYPNGPSMTYFPVPFFLSSKGYGLQLRTTRRTEVHLGSERHDAFRVSVNGADLEVAIYVADEPLAVLDAYTKETGRPFLPAPWVFGPRRRVSPNVKVDGVDEWRLLREKGVPTTGIDDSVHFLPARSELGREAELKTWVDTLHANGFKVMAYYNPYVAANHERAVPDFEHGKKNDWFLKKADGSPGIVSFISGSLLEVAAIDLTNPDAVAWFHSILRRSTDLGYDGWMHDFGEYVHRDFFARDGQSGETLHNLYPVLSAKAAHDFWMETRPDDFLFFARAGYTGTQAYVPAVWGGDPEATFDDTQGLPAALRGGLNLALSGVPWWGSDISGFKCFDAAPRDKEVYLRWAQVGAVSPIMMDQNACVAFDEKKTKWTLWSDDETTKVYGDMARLHTRLQPYFLVLAREAHATGIPAMRHPFLLFPREPSAWAVEDAFFLGPGLYASPVVRRGVAEKSTWLPPGRRYVDLDDLRVYDGGTTATIPAPLRKLPLLLVQREIVPMLDPSIMTLAPATEPGVVTPDTVKDRLDVHVALAVGDEAKLTLVDGTELVATRVAAAAGNPGALSTAATAEELATCEGCFLGAAEGDVDRLRVTTKTEEVSEIVLEDVKLVAKGKSARRVRWDVLRLR